MQNILVAGHLSVNQLKTVLAAIKQTPASRLTVYAPASERQLWPGTITFIAGELTDQAGLTAALLDQDLVLVQLDSKALIAQTQSLRIAMMTTKTTSLVVTMSDSVLSLTQTPVRWYRQHQQRAKLAAIRTVEQLLRTSQLDFTLIEGQTAADTMIYNRALSQSWITAVPARRELGLTDYLTIDLTAPFAA